VTFDVGHGRQRRCGCSGLVIADTVVCVLFWLLCVAGAASTPQPRSDPSAFAVPMADPAWRFPICGLARYEMYDCMIVSRYEHRCYSSLWVLPALDYAWTWNGHWLDGRWIIAAGVPSLRGDCTRIDCTGSMCRIGGLIGAAAAERCRLAVGGQLFHLLSGLFFWFWIP